MKKKVSIAIIDDDAALASNLKDILEAEGYSVETVHDGKAGIALFHEKMFDLALVDIKLPPIPGPELVNKLSRLRPETEYIMITAFATMETAIEAVRHKRVIGYENKPIDMDHLLTFIGQVMRRRRAEEALRESEDKYRTLVEESFDGIFIQRGPSIIFVNKRLNEMLGYGKGELIGQNHWVVYHPDYQKLTKERAQARMRGEEVLRRYEVKLQRKDGSWFYGEINARPITFPSDEEGGIQVWVKDIMEQKLAEEERIRLEAQLQQTTKMEAIATLAGGVAHEFNNALMGILGNIELLKMDLPKDERQDKYFEAMKSSGHRMSRLTDQLLAYAQGGKYQPKNLKVDDFVMQTVPILQHDLNPAIRVETHFPKDISYIKADHTQMQMILSAILANSDEAIEDDGLIKITAENKDVDEDFAKQHPGLKPGYYVCITIEDDGKGMDEETRDRIFEPFFTTKFQGRGMGMAAVYGIVKNHDGCIYVDSELGKGTIIHIYLPAISVGIKELEPAQVKEPKGALAMGEGTILVIEDEPVLLKMTREILERLGYRVLEAKTGGEGVDIAKTFDGQIDLALLDIKLPDMSGIQVYPLIMEARPDLKVVVCSGYSIDGPARKILDAGAEGFIQKPFLIAALAEKLKEVLINSD